MKKAKIPANELRLERQLEAAERKLSQLENAVDKQDSTCQRIYEKLESVRASNARKAQKVANQEAKRLKSFGVKFIRRKSLSEIKGPGGWFSSPGKVRVSDRKFATKREAVHHGKRFTKIEGHKSFSVFRSADAVNARVNWKTGKTNPMIGLKRKNRG